MLRKILVYFLLATILLQILPVAVQTAEAAPSYTDEDWEYLLQKWNAFLCGDATTDWNDPYVQKVVANVNGTTGLTTSGIAYLGGTYWLDLEENRSNPNRIFGTMDITTDISSTHMGQQFVYLSYMAKANATRGATYSCADDSGNKVTLELYRNPALRAAIFYGIEKSLTFYSLEAHDIQKVSPNNTVNYNWWDWAYQAPLQLGETLISMYPYESETESVLADTITATALELIDIIRPVTTGTTEREVTIRRTRLNTCTYLAALRKDSTLMEECRENLIFFLESDPAFHDGVKEDYSYICHTYYAMEGRYGIDVLINRIVDCFSILSGTAFELKSSNKRNQFDWMMNTFRPVMTESGVMAMNNGRVPYCGISMRSDVIKGALRLLGCFGEAEDLQLKQFIRSVVIQSTDAATQKAYATHATALGDVNLISKLKEVVIDTSVPADTEQYAQMRYMTDRAVSHRDGYTVGLAMSSNRISPYESINGCNRYGWYSGDGMLYVYVDTDSYNYDPYGDDFWRFANMYRLPGTTEEDSTLRTPQSNRCEYIPGNTYVASKGWVQEKNEYGMDSASFVGGVSLNEQYIAAAMDFESYSWTQEESEAEIKRIQNSEKSDPYAPNNQTKQVLVSDLEGKKSYFMFDDEIVCVGSDINFTTRDSVINTYVDNRQLLENTKVGDTTVYGCEDILVDGELLEKVSSFSQPLHYSDPTYVYEENFGGYYFPQGGEVYLNKTHRQSTKDGNDTNDDYNAFYKGITPLTEQHSFFELWVSHGTQPKNATYSYVMLPGKTVSETEVYTEDPDITVLVATEDLHVVRENTLGITAMVFWSAGTYGDITVDQPMILMVQEKDSTYTISASDPTQELTEATIQISRSLSPLSADSEITLSCGEETCLTLDLTQNNGKSIEARFSTESVPYLMFDFNRETSGKYLCNTYGFFDYSQARYWATSNAREATPTVNDGAMTLPLVTSPNTSNVCTTNLEPSDSPTGHAYSTDITKANYLNFDPEHAEIFQIRLKLNNVSHHGSGTAGVSLFYLPDGATKWSGASNTAASPNPWREKIFLPLEETYMAEGSSNGKYVTLSISLEDYRFCTYDLIKGLMIQFTNLRGGTVAIDHIYIGPKTNSLYFGFDSKDPTKYAEGAYGGFDFDREGSPNWGAACGKEAGNTLAIDNEKGTMTVYVTNDYNGSTAKLYGPYVETTANPGHHPGKLEEEYPLSFTTEQAEVLQIRFKTENVSRVEGLHSFVNVIYAGQKDGIITRYSDITANYETDNGPYHIITIPLSETFRSMDAIHSLGLRFRNIKATGEGDIGAVIIDYIYVGTEANMPNTDTPELLFDFENTEVSHQRYENRLYGMTDFDSIENWNPRGALSKNEIRISDGALHFERIEASGNMSVHTGKTNTTFPLHYTPGTTDYCTVRLKIENAKGSGKFSLNVFTDTSTGKDDYLSGVGSASFSPNEVSGKGYFTLSFPITAEVYGNAKEITALLPIISGLQSLDSSIPASVSIDYIRIGTEEKDEEEIPTEPVEESTWKISHTLNLASDISVNLVVSKALLDGFDMKTVYILAEVETLTEAKIVKIQPVEQGNYYYFTLKGLTAVNMSDRIRSVLYGTKDGQEYYSPVDDYSIADYAYSQLNKTTGVPDSLKVLCADLLRYGAMTQIYKDYRLDRLPDIDMTGTHKTYLTDIETVTFGNTNETLSDIPNAPMVWKGKALNLDSKVCLKFIFSMGSYTGDVSDLSLRVSYADTYGATKELVLTGSELYNAKLGYYAFTLDTMLAAELRSVVSVQVYSGNTPVSCTLQYSADTYGNNKTGTLLDVCKALFAYSDSAKAYFAK